MAERVQAQRAATPLALTLYSRRDCPLCDEMVLALSRWDAGRGRYTLEVVDIETDAQLLQRYALRIPVLACGARELCAGRFREAAIEALTAT